MAHEFESLDTTREGAHFLFSGERESIWHGGGYGQSGLYSARDARLFPEFAAPVESRPLYWEHQDTGEYEESGAQAIVRVAPSGEERLMLVASEKYDHSHHLDDLDIISELVFGDLDAARWGTLGGLNGFKRFFASAPLGLEKEVASGDSILAHFVFDTGCGVDRFASG